MCAIIFVLEQKKHKKISYQSVLLGIQMLPKHAENKTCRSQQEKRRLRIVWPSFIVEAGVVLDWI